MLAKFRQEALCEHNRVRAVHQAEPLELDDELCEIAQKYAELLASKQKLQHSQNKFEGKNLGENLAMYHHSRRDSYTGTEATNQWYKEFDSYDFSRPNYSSQTGHFSQVRSFLIYSFFSLLLIHAS